MRPWIAAVLLLALQGCVSADGLRETISGAGVSSQSFERGAEVFRLMGNPSGERCYKFLAGKWGEIERLDLPEPAARGLPLRAAVAHSLIEFLQMVRQSRPGPLNDACGALRAQSAENWSRILGAMRKATLLIP